MTTIKELGKEYADKLKKMPTFFNVNGIASEINKLVYKETGNKIDQNMKVEIIKSIQDAIINSDDQKYGILKESDNKQYIELINYMYDLIEQGK